MSPCGPRGGGVAGRRAKSGFRGAARRPRGKVGGARQACVPAAPAGSAAARGAPPAPRLHGCECLEDLAREPTASASAAQRLGRSSPRSGDNCRVGGSGHLLPRLAPAPLLSAASRGSFARRGEGAGRAPRARVGGRTRAEKEVGVRVRTAPPRGGRTLPHQHPLGGWGGCAR